MRHSVIDIIELPSMSRMEHTVVFGVTPAIFTIDFALREDDAVIIHSHYKATAISHSV